MSEKEDFRKITRMVAAMPVRAPRNEAEKLFNRVFGSIATTSRLNYRPDRYSFAPLSESIESILRSQSVSRPSFEECCRLRAEQMQNIIETEDTELFIMWSGGIDSTCAIVALLKFLPDRLHSRITVLLNKASILEYPLFFHKFIAGKLKIGSSLQPLDQIIKKGIVLTGELGDQIFGSDVNRLFLDINGQQSLGRPFLEEFSSLCGKLGFAKADTKRFLDYYLPVAEEAPFEIRSTFDFLWWFSFSQKWQHVKFRHLMVGLVSDMERAKSRVFHFFDTPEFQRWSMLNPDKKIKDSWESYKFTSKDFTFKFTGDSDYQKKVKVRSVSVIMSKGNFIAGVDEDWQPIHYNRLKDFHAKEYLC